MSAVSNAKILIADDNRENLMSICAVIQSMGSDYVIYSAPDGEAAYKILMAKHPDLVILDYEMPKMNGLEVLQKIKSKDSTKDIPVIMLTAVQSEETLQEAFALGAIDYIRKPFSKIECISRIQSVLHLSSSYKKIKRQNEVILKQNRGIEQSIEYAKKIQQSILPDEPIQHPFIKDSFVLYIPKDIVSGDFYWFSSDKSVQKLSDSTGQEKSSNNNSCTIVCGDCTGHGVPGSLMAMLGTTYLNEIVSTRKINQPAAILKQLDFFFKNNLKNSSHTTDGMDASICTVENKQLIYAGAHQSLVYFQDEELKYIKGSRKGIGGLFNDKRKVEYQQHKIDISEGNFSFYIFSDGYQDQFGGSFRKRYSSKRLMNTLQEIQKEPLNEQKAILQRTYVDWIKEGKEQQIDDVLIIGFQINNSQK